MFTRTWNHHGIRTENNLSPLQILELRRDLFPLPPNNNDWNDNETNFEVPVDTPYVQLDSLDYPLRVEKRELFAEIIRPLSLSVNKNASLVANYSEALITCLRIANDEI